MIVPNTSSSVFFYTHLPTRVLKASLFIKASRFSTPNRLWNSKASRGMAQMSYLLAVGLDRVRCQKTTYSRSGRYIDCIGMYHGQNMLCGVVVIPVFLAILWLAITIPCSWWYDHPAIFQYFIKLLTVTCMSFRWYSLIPICCMCGNIHYRFTSAWTLFGILFVATYSSIWDPNCGSLRTCHHLSTFALGVIKSKFWNTPLSC